MRHGKARYKLFVFIFILMTAVIIREAQANHLLRTRLQVEKIVCLSCLSLIEKKVQATRGTLGMQSYLEENIIVIDHASILTSESLAMLVRDLGYEASIVSVEALSPENAISFSSDYPSGCGSNGCNPQIRCGGTYSAWKELYRKIVGRTE